MYKLITTEPGFFGDEPLVSPINLHDKFMTKVASENEKIAEFVRKLKPREDGIYLHINALGGSQWGSNSNGDFFESEVLAYECPMDPGTPRIKDYGHKTFEKYAYPFKHHCNKDPNKSVGERVKFASYNPKMDRVELIVFIDRNKDPELCKKAEVGEAIPVSMGTKILWDACSICGNVAKKKEDYCFVGDTLVTMMDGTVKEISDVSEGDMVMSSDGSPTKVIKVFKREVSEELVFYKNSFNSFVTGCTKNHPVLSTKREDGVCFYRYRTAGITSCYPGSTDDCSSCQKTFPKKDFINAGLLREKDALYSPVMSVNRKPLFGSIEKAWAVGLFAAKGSFGKQNGKQSSLQYGLHEDEVEIHDRLKKFFKSEYDKDVKLYRRDDSSGVSLRIHSIEICREFYGYVGDLAGEKKFSVDVMSCSLDELEAMVGGFFDGDGHEYRRNGKLVSSRVNLCNRNLIHQIHNITSVLGHCDYIGKLFSPGGPTNRSNVLPQWYINTSYRADSGSYRLRRSNDGAYLWGNVSDITRRHYDGEVFNLETESGTYVANSMCVHNCDHLKYAMNKVLPDGRKVYANNAYPRFFDISFVLSPAEKASYVMKKVASSNIVVPSAFIADALEIEEPKISEDKKAEIKKEIPIDEVRTEQPKQDVIKAFSGLIPKICSFEPSMSDKDLKGLSEYPLKDILSSISGLGMVLQPREFQKIVIIKSGRGEKDLDPKISSDGINGDILSLIRKYVVDRSSYRPAARMRIVKLASQKPAINEDQTLQQDLVSEGLPTLAMIAGLYDLYRTKLGKLDKSFLMDALRKKPVLTTLLGGAGAAGLGIVANQFEKQAGLRKMTPVKAIGALTYPYFVQAYQKEKYRKTGKKPGEIGMQFVKHPGLIGLASLYGASKLMKKASDNASISDRLRENKVITWPLVEDAPDDLIDVAIVNGFTNI